MEREREKRAMHTHGVRSYFTLSAIKASQRRA
jgi:hypothetical protein